MTRPTIVTVVEMAQTPGRWEVSVQSRGELVVNRREAGRDPGAAAAKAMQLALEWENNGYVILGSEKVLAFIPERVRMSA